LALFGYVILADGFVRVRARRASPRSTSARAKRPASAVSYYRDGPGNGLIVPTDVALYPILPSWAGDSNMMEQRDIVWSNMKPRSNKAG
jgi:hypothetical protein